MIQGEVDIKQIFGLKVKELRTRLKLSFQALSKKTNLSVSYLNEIEKGKKYPKGDKIINLANALEVSYDYLVSLKVPKKIEPIVSLLQSDFFRQLPLELFGLDTQKFIELISTNPEKINAFISTIMQVARSYEVGRENIYHAALRSYQEINDNYFPELELSVEAFKKEFDFETSSSYQKEDLVHVLENYYGISIDYDSLNRQSVLKHIRSHFHINNKTLSISRNLEESQIQFLLMREIAFQYLKLKVRPIETPAQRNYSFPELLNNFKASYFAVAFLLDKRILIKDINTFIHSRQWHDTDVIDILKKFNATPEMLMQRLTNILPKYYGFNNLFFLKITNKPGTDGYRLTKELHLSKLHSPHSNELNEHYCRRWVSVGIIQELLAQKKSSTIARMQVSKYFHTKNRYLCLSIAFPNSSNPKEGISITVGFQIDNKLKKGIDFLEDPKILEKEVHTTCERCPAKDCKDRVAPALQLEKAKAKQAIVKALESFDNN